MSALGRFLGIAFAVGALTPLLAWLAPRIGWTDRARGPDAARKLQRRPVPAVGGAALFLGLFLLAEPPWSAPGRALWGAWLPGPAWIVAGLAGALLAGTWDDLRPLRPLAKLAAQALGVGPLVLGGGLEHGPGAALGLWLLALVLLNLLNTYDNADGALAGLALAGFALPRPELAASVLGFLPWNLDAARPALRASGAPSAYLGDAGAFLLAVLVLVTPESAGMLVLPALDLARLSVARWRRGSRPWIGDRAHLAHLLAARGLSRATVAVALAAAAAPGCLGLPAALAAGRADLAGLALGASALLYAALLRLARARATP